MLVEYGFGAINIGDKRYEISPTFQNIAKLGKPRDIVETFTSFINCPSITWQYHRAVEIVQACCEPKLPESVVGRFRVDEKGRMKLVNPPPEFFIHDMIMWAIHIFRFGVVGVTDEELSEHGEPIKEFNPYRFIGEACEHLGRTREQAADMTLTEFIMACDIRFPEQKKEREEKARKVKSLNALMEYQKELDEKAAQKRAAKQS